MRHFFLFVFCFGLTACGQPEADGDHDTIPDTDDCYPDQWGGGRISDCDCPDNPATPDDCFGEADTDTDTDTDSDTDADTDVDTGVESVWYLDSDGDGYGNADYRIIYDTQPPGYVANSDDCDDSNASVNPGATEVCNEVDDNCDGNIDEGLTSTFYADEDGDGYGDALKTVEACAVPDGYVTDATDCDDADPRVFPGNQEVCDGLDNDCNGAADDNAADAFTWYFDGDGDGYGVETVAVSACAIPSGYAEFYGDCDDTDFAVNPAATEVCDSVDNDCDSATDEDDAADALTWYADTDADGYGNATVSHVLCYQPAGFVADSTDCDDSNMNVNPGATEVCNGLDDDCNGSVDGSDAIDVNTWYADTDDDGYGDSAYSFVSCEAPVGYVSDATDCDDSEAGTYPGATEYCDSVDNDCDGAIDEDEAADVSTWYADTDDDGYGDSAYSFVSCEAPVGYVSDATDCDDSDSSVYPGATEYCNGLDDDCDGVVDDGVSSTTWYLDADGDGYGDSSTALTTCGALSGYVVTDGDCDDANAAINPAATEVCDGLDNDCDGVVDDGCVLYDADGDGYSTALDCDDSDASVNPDATEVCGDGKDNDCSGGDLDCDDVDWDGDGLSVNAGDCDDSDASVYSGAAENCDNGTDDNCDSLVDYNDGDCRGYVDSDGDGYAASTDCDDSDASVHPGAEEVCDDGLDQDCDGSDLDCEDVDADSDGYPAATDCDETNPDVHPGAEEVCNNGLDDDCDGVDLSCDSVDDDGDGYTEADGDCDDTDEDAYPGATEVCYDSIDNDCNDSVDDGCPAWDTDGDGYSTISDCDDSDASVYPGATEAADGLDNDCDGMIDEETDVYDDDGDGYTEADGDCDDGDPTIYPGADEYCDGLDNDCDDSVDEASAADADTWYVDNDSDGYGDPAISMTSCSQPLGYVADNTDCDGAEATVYPGATETCGDDIDQDCDGSDEICPPVMYTWYADSDEDGFGDPAVSVVAATQPSGYVDDDTDCDDTSELISPLATEACDDGVDNDCDGSVDETTCLGVIACVMNVDGVTLEVTITGDVASGLMMPLSSVTIIGVEAWLSGGTSETPYLGATVGHLFLVYPASNFTPYASDGTTDEWFDLMKWSATGECLVAEDGLGGYLVEYLSE
jgi:hypothetical protein